MGVRREQAWVRSLHADAAANERIRHHIETASMPREPRRSIPDPGPCAGATASQIKRWMRANADDYDTATHLVEGANVSLSIDQGLIDNGTSWVWDFAARLKDDA